MKVEFRTGNRATLFHFRTLSGHYLTVIIDRMAIRKSRPDNNTGNVNVHNGRDARVSHAIVQRFSAVDIGGGRDDVVVMVVGLLTVPNRTKSRNRIAKRSLLRISGRPEEGGSGGAERGGGWGGALNRKTIGRLNRSRLGKRGTARPHASKPAVDSINRPESRLNSALLPFRSLTARKDVSRMVALLHSLDNTSEIEAGFLVATVLRRSRTLDLSLRRNRNDTE